MSRPNRTLFPGTQRRAVALGTRVKAARQRRRITETEMAARVLVSRPTIRKLEAGDLTVSLAVLAQVLEVLGLDGDLDRIAADDELGHQLADARLPRPRRPDAPSLADEL
jgi:transcriptional regulator with XRE-family HTH domain